MLVQDGTISEGDLFIAGTVDGKVRALFDHLGRKVKKAGPATPVEVLGLSSLPQPGDTFQVIDDPIKARQVVAYRQAQAKERALGGKGGRLTLESLQQQMAEGGMKELPIIIKADVQGSAEVLADTLAKLSDERVKIRIIHTGVGAINESDVLLATASNAIIIGFNVRPDRNAADVAEREKVDIRQHSVIYNVTDEMKKAMAGPARADAQGNARSATAEVRQTFKTPKVGTIAGCMVARRPHHAQRRCAGAAPPRQRRGLDGPARVAPAVQGRRVSEVKAGLECGIVARALQRRQGRRHHRGVQRGAGRADGLMAGSRLEVSSHRLSSMTVALLSLELYLPMSQSLKDKRMVLRRLKDRLGALQRRRRGGGAPGPLAAGGPGGGHRRVVRRRSPSRRCRRSCTRSSGSNPVS